MEKQVIEVSALESRLVARCRCTPSDVGTRSSSSDPASHRALREGQAARPLAAGHDRVPAGHDRDPAGHDRDPERSQHRNEKNADLLIAPSTESTGLVPDDDQNFERITDVSRQPTEWILPAAARP